MSEQPKTTSPTPASLHAEVEDRLGTLPDFFRLAPEAPEVAANLWGFARFGYLDNPLPPLFKERLFVSLSRFCEVRYCIARHVGFLAGLGRPAGDRLCPPETVEQVVRLIRRPLPRGDDLELPLSLLETCEAPLPALPDSDTPAEQAIFACGTHVFLQTPQAPRCREALRRVFDGAMFQHLLVFLAFVRTAHYWTQLHPELRVEEDVADLLAVHESLADCVANDPEAATCETTRGLSEELAGLRRERASRLDVERANVTLREREAELQEAQRIAHVGSWRWDAATDRVTGSHELFRIYGLDPVRPFPDFNAQDGTLYPHEEWERLGRAVRESLRTGVGYQLDVQAFRHGEPIWVTTRGEADKDAAGRIVGLRGTVQDMTDRRRADEAVRLHDRQLQFVTDHAAVLIAQCDSAGRYKFVNRPYAARFGLEPRDVIGKHLADVVGVDAFGTFRHRVEDVLAGQPVQFEVEIPYRTGGTQFVRCAYTPERDGSGRVVGWVAVIIDISDRRRAEEALRESEGRFRHLADAMPQIVWTARPDGQIDYLNRRWAEYTGLPADAGNAGWSQALHREDAPQAAGRWAASLRGGEPFEMEVRLRGRGGESYRWHLIRTVAVTDESGRVARWFGTGTDIHQQKRAEESSRYLAQASAALAGLVDYPSTLQKVVNLAVPHFGDWSAVDVADGDGHLRRLAVAHQDRTKIDLVRRLMREYPPDPHAPVGAYAVHQTGEPEFIAEVADDLLVAGAQDERHLGLIRALGLKSYICVPLVVAGRPFGVLTFATAESGRTYTAADLALATDLAHRAAVAVENARLYQALKDADRRKDEFLATLAHELRNPLAPIRNGLQVLRLGGATGEVAEDARRMMERQLSQMVHLVDDLLDLSRISRGKIELRKARVDLAQVVQQAVETSRPLIAANGHDLTVSVPPGPVYVDADPTRLAQVFSNLLNNAAKYTERGGRVRLSAQQRGGEVAVAVRDTGIGIPAHMLSRVFEMFTQVDRHLERAQGGLGIGLSIVKRLVDMHGGSVEARSDGHGLGSEFTVRLPVVLSAVPPPTAAAEPRRPSGRRRVLVVDDNRDAADSLAVVLQLLGNETQTAHDGVEAVEAAAAYRPDLILLDIGMPKMNGYDAARHIRQQPWGAGVVLVALTGWGQEEDRRKSRDAGFDAHVTKPIDPAALETLLAGLNAEAG